MSLCPVHPYTKVGDWKMCKCRNKLEGCRCGGKRCKNNARIEGPDGRWCIECCPKVEVKAPEVEAGESQVAEEAEPARSPFLFEDRDAGSEVEYPPGPPPDGYVEVPVGDWCVILRKKVKVSKYTASRNRVGEVWRCIQWVIVKLPHVLHFGFGCLADVAVYKQVWEGADLIHFSHAGP